MLHVNEHRQRTTSETSIGSVTSQSTIPPVSITGYKHAAPSIRNLLHPALYLLKGIRSSYVHIRFTLLNLFSLVGGQTESEEAADEAAEGGSEETPAKRRSQYGDQREERKPEQHQE